MPSIVPADKDISTGFSSMAETHSTTEISVTTLSEGTLLAGYTFTNVEPCDFLAIASVNIRQSGFIAARAGIILSIWLDGAQIGYGSTWCGEVTNMADIVRGSNGAIGVAQDVPPGSHVVELRGVATFGPTGTPTIWASVREFQTIELYR